MAIFYSNINENNNLVNKRKKEAKLIEKIVMNLKEEQLLSGLTEEQEFLIQYYDLDKNDINQNNFNVFEIERNIGNRDEISRERLEIDRYEALINLYSAIEEFDEVEINQYNDRFHEEIKSWEDYSKDFEQVPLMVKKM